MSAASSAAQQALQTAPHAHTTVSYLHCPLCLDPFHATQSKLQPRLLPACAHTLCTRCLQQQWALQAAERLHPTFLCPLDSAPVRVTQVDDIPLNKILLGLLSVMQSSDQSERDFKVGAYARAKCVEEDCDAEAVWHCFNDDADMCEEHKASSHDGLRSNITKSHRLVRLEEKEARRGPPTCLAHHSAMLLWCTTCRVHACHACATLPPHVDHPSSLKLLGHHGSSGPSVVGALASSTGDNYYSDHQAQVIVNVLEEEKKMKNTMEKEAKELIQTLQVIDSNELHTQQSLDTEFDNLISALEARRFEMQAELARQSSQARQQLDARMLALSLNHSLSNTVLEEGTRILNMSAYSLVGYMDNLLVRHEKALEKYWAFLYESSLVSWFPLRMAKEALSREVAQLGNIGVPPPPAFRLEDCRSEYNSIEVCWEVGAVAGANNNNALIGGGGGAATTGVKSAAAAEESKAILRLTSIAPAPAGAPTSAQNIPPSFFILHMSAIDPFDLSQDHLLFGEIYRGPLTGFVVNGLQPGRSYLFRVQAVSIMGEGVWSQKICMSTLNQPAPQPQAPVVSAAQERTGSLFGTGTPSTSGYGREGAQHGLSAHHRPSGSGAGMLGNNSGGSFGAPLPSASHSGFHTTTNSGATSPVHRGMGANGYAKSVPASAHQHQHQHSQQMHDPHAMGRTPLQSMPSSALPSALPSPRRSAALAAASTSSPSMQQHKPSHAPSPRVGWDELHKLSMILREKDVPALMRFFAAPLPVDSAPLTPRSFQLLYRGSRDGMSTRAWHLAVDGMGPTLSVIRVKKDNRDYVFGAFAAESWSSPAAEASYKATGSNWLFSLINAYKRNLKFKVKRGQEKYAQCNDREHAAMFGAGGDLALLDPFDAPHHHFGLDSYELDSDADARAGLPPFVLPPGQTQCQSNMLAGGELFQCKEVECYAVNC